ncbi:MAG TPA: diacylglycerol kinase family protein, partial [Polyangiaceae bacterium]
YRSFGHALRGLSTLVRTQHNARIHLVAAASVVTAGWFVELGSSEWVLLTLTITLVFLAEAVNTALEFLADAVMPIQHPLIGKAKDVAAAGVLLAAIASVVVGILLFGPRIAQAN